MSNTPTDAEIVAVMRDGYNCRYNDEQDHIDFARAVLAKWGTPPAVAGEPVAPDFYTACALYKEGGEAGWIPLPGYSNETEHGVKHLVLESARKEGYKGTADGRLVELGWEIRPVYLTPQPTNSAPAAQGDASWPRLRSALAMAMLGWGYRQDQDRTIETCYTVLDAITEPGMPLALLRTAPDWRYAARSQDKQGGAHHD